MSKSKAKAAEELEILHPERVVLLAGEQITVREFSFMQGMMLHGTIDPLVAGLAEYFQVEAKDMTMDSLMGVFASNSGEWVVCMAESCGKPVEWVQQLNDADGSILSMAVWGVNKDFFMRRIMARAREAVMRNEVDQKVAKAMQSARESSMPPSSPTGTDSATSKPTPPDS